MRTRPRSRSVARKGAAALEAAMFLPLLLFLFIIGADYARILHNASVITQCAYNGAMVARLTPYDPESPYGSDAEAAALAEVGALTPTPTVSVDTTASGGKNVRVTVTYTFSTVLPWNGVAGYSDLGPTITLTRSVEMEKSPNYPIPPGA